MNLINIECFADATLYGLAQRSTRYYWNYEKTHSNGQTNVCLLSSGMEENERNWYAKFSVCVKNDSKWEKKNRAQYSMSMSSLWWWLLSFKWKENIYMYHIIYVNEWVSTVQTKHWNAIERRNQFAASLNYIFGAQIESVLFILFANGTDPSISIAREFKSWNFVFSWSLWLGCSLER